VPYSKKNGTCYDACSLCGKNVAAFKAKGVRPTMRGICGQIGFENSAISIENLEAMTSRLSSRGPFAIAHRDSGDLFLARDRLGIKPLYDAITNKTLRFASSLKGFINPSGMLSQ
jgi:asparagine synthetase B (glutamine-hydrolysing)